jgi:hypothetical protein
MMRPIVRLGLAHAAGNAILLWLGYYWLGIGESQPIALAWSLLVALAAVCYGCWLYGGALAYFAGKDPSMTRAFRDSARNLLPIVAAAAVALLLYFALAKWAAYSSNPAFRIASFLTLKIRKPVKPSSIQVILQAALWAARWVAVPVLLLPMFAAICLRGWRGFAGFGALARRPLYWVATPLLLVCSLWLPFRLLGWTPRGRFGFELASFVLRAIVAYLLFVAGWLALAFFSSGGRPRWSQPKTVVSP